MPLTVKRHKKRKVVKHTNKKNTRKQHSKLPKIQIPQISEMWDDRKSTKKNFSEMGLAYDPNVSVRHSSKSSQLKNDSQKVNTVTKLETEAKALRKVNFKFPKAQATYFSYLITKYGDNYEAMAKDPKNIYQETWKQIRSKIMKFKKLEQYRKVMCGS